MKMKKGLSLLICLVLVFSLFTVFATSVSAADMCTVAIQIYRNGNTSDVYKSVSLPKVEKGTDFDVTALDINDYYKASYGFKFDGFFNDGGWNNYKAGKPATPLTTIKINGWTNLKCMVTDYQVVDMVIYRNGNTSTPYKTISLPKMTKGSELDVTQFDINDYYTESGVLKFDGFFNDGGWNNYKAGKSATPLTTIKINGWTHLKCMVIDEEMLGDVDNDGDVDLSDALMIQQYVMKNREFTGLQKAVADFDKDTDIDTDDAMAIMAFYLIK